MEEARNAIDAGPRNIDLIQLLDPGVRIPVPIMKLHKCKYCGKKFRHRIIKVEHILAAHKDQVGNKSDGKNKKNEEIKCKFCSKTYANLDGYNNHVANFHRYKCPNCLIDCCNLEKYNNHIAICQARNPFNPQKRVQIPPVAGTVVADGATHR